MDPRPALTYARESCLGDHACVVACPRGAISVAPEGVAIARERCLPCPACSDACAAEALELVGRERGAGDLVEELCRDRSFYKSSGGGVTFSGGEPTSQLSFLLEVLEGCGREGLHRALDTCGAVGPDGLERVLGQVELVLLDLKQLDPDLHLEQTGIPLAHVLGSARLIAKSGVPTWVRTPVIPGFTDSEENIRAIVRFIRAELPHVQRFDLLAFSKLCLSKYRQLGLEDPAVASIPLVSREHLERLREIALGEGLSNVVWSGMTREL
jgi:pyruvate formate lyase activating enzyme